MLDIEEVKMIFVSHSNKDNDFVSKLVNDLKDSGIQTWVDFSDIKAGTDWNDSIQTAMKEASIILIIWSNNSVSSPEVLAEVFQGKYENKEIIQVRMDNCKPPAQFAKFQSINFYENFPAAFESLFSILPIAKRKRRVMELQNMLPQNPFHEIPHI